jgi:hypothetical protein
MREDFTEQQLYLNAAPLYMRLREYHCINPQSPVPTGDADMFDDSISNAWIPSGVKICENRVRRSYISHSNLSLTSMLCYL